MFCLPKPILSFPKFGIFAAPYTFTYYFLIGFLPRFVWARARNTLTYSKCHFSPNLVIFSKTF